MANHRKVTEEQVHAHVRKNPGQTAQAIRGAKAGEACRSALVPPLKRAWSNPHDARVDDAASERP